MLGVVFVLAVTLLAGASTSAPPPRPPLASFNAPLVLLPPPKKHKRLHIQPLTPALRAKGYHECYPPDPDGLGPYSSYRTIAMGARMLIPQKGGHTSDMGYDVLVHFHGHEAARKMLVQVARGVVYVGLDEGLGSGPYADAFEAPGTFPRLKRSITAALKEYSHDDRAHIRHLALSAWSAGYGAVNEILKHGDQGIDAVMLLDALHAGWAYGHHHEKTAEGASSANVQPVFDFARRALHGQKIFIFTHSQIDPVTYPSTRQTADLMLSDFGLARTPVDPGDQPFGMTGRVDVKGFHVWSYLGRNKDAHCAHLEHLAPALAIIEDAWHTPAMDRDVPFHRAPKLGGGEKTQDDAGTPQAGDTSDSPATPTAADDDATEPAQHGADSPDTDAVHALLPEPGSAVTPADKGAPDLPGVSGPSSLPEVHKTSTGSATPAAAQSK